jgi:iron complex transport system substrate-binding protein
MRRPTPAIVATLLTGALLVAGCGDGEADTAAERSSSPSASAQFPVTIDTPVGEVTIEEQPQRIVSLSPSATESLFAIGAGDQVVAADAYSNYPQQAPTTELSGFEPNVEAIVGYQPDLVVAANDADDMVASLEELEIPVLISPAPATVEEGYDGIAALGLATGHVDETAEVVSQLRSDIEQALAQAPEREVRVYHELDDTFFAASSYGFIGSVYAEMGAENIADAADKEKSGFPQMTEEAIIGADPELIVITDEVTYTAEDVAQRPGWGNVSAVKNDNIVTVNSDIASRWGPRLPQLIDAVAEAMETVPANAG